MGYTGIQVVQKTLEQIKMNPFRTYEVLNNLILFERFIQYQSFTPFLSMKIYFQNIDFQEMSDNVNVVKSPHHFELIINLI